ncbi:MAG: hypothetical protein FWD68_06500, partial [Alphaproteobacteria bacterium]|nr:hypothetical protein [Alphaproteobacteria bacterium]
RIEFNGRWIVVPEKCFSGASFGTDSISVSPDSGGFGINLTGRSSDGKDDVKLLLYGGNEISCARKEPCSGQDNPKNECARWLVE